MYQGVDPRIFESTVIRPALKKIGLWSAAAEQLLLGTAIHESQGFRHRKQVNGPALGYFQMEPATHNDIWKNYLAYHQHLAGLVSSLLPSLKANKLTELEFNDKYSAAMARIQYNRTSEPLPAFGNIQGQALYWKKHYNTPLGRGTPEEYLADWKALMGSN